MRSARPFSLGLGHTVQDRLHLTRQDEITDTESNHLQTERLSAVANPVF